MPPRKRTSSVLNGEAEHEPADTAEPVPSGDGSALADALEEAEAEAAEAEAALAVARARARALKLRRQAEAAAASATAVTPAPTAPATPAAPAVVDAVPAEAEKVDEVEPVEEAAPVQKTAPAEAETVAAPDELAPEELAPDELADAPNRLADDDADEAVLYDDEAGEPARRRIPRIPLPHVGPKTLVASLIVLVSVGLLGASAWMGFQHRQASEQRQRTAELMAAARQGVVTMMSLNFNSAQDDVKRIIDNTTGDFRRDFQGQADEFAKVAQASKVVTEATVNATAVQSMTNDGGTVLVAVTTQVSNAASKEQEPRSWRLKVDMARDGGQLKLAKVEFVP